MFGVEEISELSDRWRQARCSALRSVAEPKAADAEQTEAQLLSRAVEHDAAEAFRKVFENSRRLGESFARFHRRTPELSELPELLGRLESPCLSAGRWTHSEAEGAATLERAPCRASVEASVCDYWREAIDGLVLGMSGEVRHTRHRSRGHGQEDCRDVLYENPESPLRYGEMPPEMSADLERIRAFAAQFKGAELNFLGVSEGVLLYELEVPGAKGGCGASGSGGLQKLLESSMRSRFPKLQFHRFTARSVLDNPNAPMDSASHERPAP